MNGIKPSKGGVRRHSQEDGMVVKAMQGSYSLNISEIN
jgi:hypothetical protein